MLKNNLNIINLSNTAPPELLNINGGAYPINTDYRTWIDVSNKFQELDVVNDDYKSKVQNAKILCEIMILAFGKLIDEPVQDTLEVMAEFIKGYPKIDNGYSGLEEADGTKLYSFLHDINYIIIAIRNQTGIDLSYTRKKPFHWWLFMLEFQTLESKHYIKEIISCRGYKGDNREMQDVRDSVALPMELTKAEQRIAKEYDSVFFNT